VGIVFFLRTDEARKEEIYEGGVVAAQVARGWIGKPVAKGQLRFHHLLAADYEYSPEWSDKRTFYYKVTTGRIERVPAATGKKWKIFGSKPIPDLTMQ
jgi:hypothetical protein